MKAQWLALLTAVCWGVGGYFEKKGLHLGQLPPQLGIALRTGVALAVLGVAAGPHWRMLPQAGARSLTYMVVGGGLVAGALGMLCFYSALKGAPLNRVMPLAFTAPLFGALAAVVVGGEPVSGRMLLGMALTVGGIAVLTTG